MLARLRGPIGLDDLSAVRSAARRQLRADSAAESQSALVASAEAVQNSLWAAGYAGAQFAEEASLWAEVEGEVVTETPSVD